MARSRGSVLEEDFSILVVEMRNRGLKQGFTEELGGKTLEDKGLQ